MAHARGGGSVELPKCTIRREPHIVVVRLCGKIDDRDSEDWRTRLDEEMSTRGTPRFVAFDMLDANPQNSMSTRFQVAAYARALARRVERVVLLMPQSLGASMVVRVIIGIVASPNVTAVGTKAAFDKEIDALRRGDESWRAR